MGLFVMYKSEYKDIPLLTLQLEYDILNRVGLLIREYPFITGGGGRNI